MKTKEWITLILVVIVVAVLASLITANITGNVTSMGSRGNKGVLSPFNKCVQVEPNAQKNRWCGETCLAIKKKTIGSYTHITYVENNSEEKDLEIIPIFEWGDSQPMPSCSDNQGSCSANRQELMELESGFSTSAIRLHNMTIDSRCICC